MIKYCVITILALVSFKGIKICNHVTPKQKIEAIEVRDIDPVMGETFYRIFYSDALVLYQSQYRFVSSVNQLGFDSSTNQFPSEITFSSGEWKKKYFIFQKDSSYGYNYDPYRSNKDNIRLRADSVVKFITGTNRWDSFLLIKPDSAIWNTDNSELKEVYVFPKKQDMPTGRLSLYYSRNMNHLKKSFNRIVDSTKKMKLFKTETIFNKFYNEKDNILWPSTKYLTKMREITVENPEEIIGYFNRYKKSSKGRLSRI